MHSLALPLSRRHRPTLVALAAVLASTAGAQVSWRQRNFDAMFAPAMAYDGARNRTVLFGSLSGNRPFTAEWDGHDWQTRQPATSPPSRVEHAMAFDSVRGRIVLFAAPTVRAPISTTLGNGTAPIGRSAPPPRRRANARST